MPSLNEHLLERMRAFAPANAQASETKALLDSLYAVCDGVILSPHPDVKAHERLVAKLDDRDRATARSVLAMLILDNRSVRTELFSPTNRQSLVGLADGLLPRWRAIIAPMQALGGCAKRAANQAEFARFYHNLAQFELAIVPRNVLTLLKDPTIFEARFAQFEEQLAKTDEEITQAVQTAMTEKSYLAADIARFLERTPTARLRTYTDAHLVNVLDNFCRFDLCVRFLEGRQSLRKLVTTGVAQSMVLRRYLDQLSASYQSKAEMARKELIDWYRSLSSPDLTKQTGQLDRIVRIIENALEDEWQRQRSQIRGKLVSNVRQIFSYCAYQTLEEACQEAVNSAVTKVNGYTFEGPFDAWLFNTATGLAKTTLSKQPPNDNELPDVIVPPPAFNAGLQEVELLAEWRYGYLLIESSFTGEESLRIAKAVWARMLQHLFETEGASDATDKLKYYRPLVKELGISEDTLYTVMRRLRQKLYAHFYVLNERTDSSASQSADALLFESMRKRFPRKRGHGVNAPESPLDDETTLRRFAALTRACRDDLRWSIITRGLVDKKGRLDRNRCDSKDEWLNLVTRLCHLWDGAASSQKLLATADFAWDWVETDERSHNPEFGLTGARRLLVDHNVEFFLPASWYLAIIKQSQAGQANDVLRPAPEERPWVTEAVTHLQGARTGAPPMDDRNNRPTQQRPAARSRLAPQELIVAFLTGEPFASEDLTAAMQELATTNPTLFAQLRQRLTSGAWLATEFADWECAEISESLLDYLALGDQAATRMPEVDQHLTGCAQCATELATLREITAQPEPKTGEDTAAQPQFLLWTMTGWMRSQISYVGAEIRSVVSRSAQQNITVGKMVTEQQQKTHQRQRAPLTKGDEGKQVGDWRLSLIWEPRLAHDSSASQAPQSLEFNVPIPDTTTQITLRVTPRNEATGHRWIWDMQVSLDPKGPAPDFVVGIGKKEGPTTGMRTVRADRPAMFSSLTPPVEESYWLHVEWRSVQNQWQATRFEIPLRSEPTGRGI